LLVDEEEEENASERQETVEPDTEPVIQSIAASSPVVLIDSVSVPNADDPTSGETLMVHITSPPPVHTNAKREAGPTAKKLAPNRPISRLSSKHGSGAAPPAEPRPKNKSKDKVAKPTGAGRKGVSSGLSTIVRVNGRPVKGQRPSAGGAAGGDWWSQMSGGTTSKASRR